MDKYFRIKRGLRYDQKMSNLAYLGTEKLRGVGDGEPTWKPHYTLYFSQV